MPGSTNASERSPERNDNPELVSWKDASLTRRIFLVGVWIGSFVMAMFISLGVAIGILHSGANAVLVSVLVSLISSLVVVRTIGGAIRVRVFRPSPNENNPGWG